MIQRISAQLVRGFLMGTADIVPGVSGGTIALVLGIYEGLIDNVSQGAKALGRLVRGDVKGMFTQIGRIDWWFIIPLGIGIVAAVVTLSSVLTTQLEERPIMMSAIFFGLIVASIVVAWDALTKHDGLRLGVMLVVAVVAFFVLGLSNGSNDDPSPLFVAGAGAVAISAAILPGVSGSFILVMLGLYDHVISAIDDRELTTIAIFGAGAIVGLAVFSSVLKWLLTNHHDTVVAALIGLMIGSLRILWPWPAAPEGGIEETALGAPDGDIVPAVLGFGLAIVAVLGLANLGRTDRSRTSSRH